MPDFHVVALLYRLESSDHVSYAEPPPLVFEDEVARFRLEKDQLRSELKLHVGTLEEARALVDPILARKAAPLLDVSVSEFMRLRKNE